jgi:hypothetical protein
MRKTINVLGGAFLLATLAAPNAASAQAAPQLDPGSSSINLTGEIPRITIIPDAPSSIAGANVTKNGNTINLNALTDSSGRLNNTNFILTYNGVTTNYLAKIGVFSPAMALKNGINIIPYQAQARVTGSELVSDICAPEHQLPEYIPIR